MTQSLPMTLECGRDLTALVEQVADGVPPTDPEHQASCAYCQEALCRLRTATGQIRELGGVRVQVPDGLGRRVMAQLRRERGRVPLAGGSGGVDTVDDAVVTQIVRRAVLAVPGVLQCSVVVGSTTDEGLALTIHLTATLGPSLPGIGAEVRERVAADLHELAGLRTAGIAVHVDDVE